MREPVDACIGLGANLGDALAAVSAAMNAISRWPQMREVARSDLYRSAPVDAAGPPYVNAVLRVLSTMTAPEILVALQGLEKAAGRVRAYRNAPRTLDLDLLRYGSASINSPALTVPHPRAYERAFVLVPLAQVDPAAVSPQDLMRVADQVVERLT